MPRKSCFAVLAFCGMLLFLCCCALPARAADIPSIEDSLLEDSLALGGSNRPQLEAALAACIQQPWMMQAMRFTIASLPAADLGRISAEELRENLELAQAARADNPWGLSYDDATFAHYVLPPRVSQEPLSEWRSYFKEEVGQAVSGLATLDEAALAVNRWCGERVGFRQTQRRDQGPLATLASGYGRCEELCIIYIAACRSVGVPARMAYCPWWAVSDNNHAWVEVLGSDGAWHFVGAAEPADSLDNAWFEGAARRAPLVVSICFGLPEGTQSDVLNMESAAGARYCRINSTRFYRQTGWLEAELSPEVMQTMARHQQELGQAHELPRLIVSIFNYGALREVASVPFNDEGLARIELGAGSYVLSTDAPVYGKVLLAEVAADATLRVDWDSAEEAPSELLLHFPEG